MNTNETFKIYTQNKNDLNKLIYVWGVNCNVVLIFIWIESFIIYTQIYIIALMWDAVCIRNQKKNATTMYNRKKVLTNNTWEKYLKKNF